jgi:hypothetical protein
MKVMNRAYKCFGWGGAFKRRLLTQAGIAVIHRQADSPALVTGANSLTSS